MKAINPPWGQMPKLHSHLEEAMSNGRCQFLYLLVEWLTCSQQASWKVKSDSSVLTREPLVEVGLGRCPKKPAPEVDPGEKEDVNNDLLHSAIL